MTGLVAETDTVQHLKDGYGLAGGAGELSPVARGAMGRIWRLSVGGLGYAVKEFFWGAPPELTVAREVALRDRAAAVGVRSPASIRTVSGGYVLDLPAGGPVRLYDWARGRPVRGDDPGRAAWVGRTLGILHALRQPAGPDGPDPWYDRTVGDWPDLVSRARAQRLSWADTLHAAIPDLAELRRLLRPARTDQLYYTHQDFQPQNVLREPGGSFTLLDWDDAGPGVPDRGVASALWNWHVRNGRLDEDGVQATMAAYRQAGGTATLTDRESFTQLLASYLNYLHAQAGLCLDPNQPGPMRDHATREVLAALADPPQLPMLARILTLVGETRLPV